MCNSNGSEKKDVATSLYDVDWQGKNVGKAGNSLIKFNKIQTSLSPNIFSFSEQRGSSQFFNFNF